MSLAQLRQTAVGCDHVLSVLRRAPDGYRGYISRVRQSCHQSHFKTLWNMRKFHELPIQIRRELEEVVNAWKQEKPEWLKLSWAGRYSDNKQSRDLLGWFGTSQNLALLERFCKILSKLWCHGEYKESCYSYGMTLYSGVMKREVGPTRMSSFKVFWDSMVVTHTKTRLRGGQHVEDRVHRML